MRLLSALLYQDGSLEVYQGEAGLGSTFAAPVDVRLYLEPRRVSTRTEKGETVVGEAVAYMRPESGASTGDRLTVGGVAYRVIGATELYDGKRPLARLLKLGRSES